MKPLFFFISLFAALPLSASHLLGGYVGYKTNGSLNCQITVKLLKDTNSSGGGNGTLNFGDGTFVEGDFEINEEIIGENISVISFTVDHSYPGPGTYKVSYEESNYNSGIQNIINAVNQPIIISAKLVLSTVIESNNSPVLELFSNQKGLHGIAQTINPAAYDSDGDSLSFKLITPEVEDYSFPNNPDFYDDFSAGNESDTGEPEYSVNPITGDILWDAPGFLGEYIIAVNITQWRKVEGQWANIGENQVVLYDIINDGEQEITLSVPASSCFDKEADVQGSFIIQGPPDKEYSVEVFVDLEGGLINGEPVEPNESVNYILDEDLQLDITISPDQVLESFKPYKVVLMVKTESESLTAGWGFVLGCEDLPGNVPPEPIVTSTEEVHNEFLIYPNPTFNKYINVSIPHIRDGNKYVRILDIAGQTLFERYVSPTIFPLKVDLTHFHPGIYIFQLENYTGKFVIEE